MKILDFIKKNKSFLLGLLILLAVRWSFADQYRVPSGSMEPNIHVGDHVGVSKVAYDLKIPFTHQVIHRMSEPRRGDIVVFEFPKDPSINFIKRLIGVPGDRIHIENGFITINGQELTKIDLNLNSGNQNYFETLGEHRFIVQRSPFEARSESLDFVVPEDSYFFMGDNRDNSLDSRSWGFVKREAIKGKALGVLWNIRFDQTLPRMDLRRILSPLS